MSSTKTIRELESQIECAYQHLERLWDDRAKAIEEFLDTHNDWIHISITILFVHYVMAPEMATHLIDYTYNLLSKEREFSYEDANELIRNIIHKHHSGEIMLKGELVSKHLMVRYLDYLKEEYPDYVLDMTFMVEKDKEDKYQR